LNAHVLPPDPANEVDKNAFNAVAPEIIQVITRPKIILVLIGSFPEITVTAGVRIAIAVYNDP
jgi:hypothetical protein